MHLLLTCRRQHPPVCSCRRPGDFSTHGRRHLDLLPRTRRRLGGTVRGRPKYACARTHMAGRV